MPNRPFDLLARGAILLLGASLLAACSSDAPPDAPRGPLADDSTAFWPMATALPRFDLNTAGGAPITSKDVYVSGTFSVTDTVPGAATASGATDVKGHGNSTWALFPKKPYRLKLASSTSILGMPANKNWVLLANYSDKTLLRNDVAFEMSRRFGFAYTPRTQFADLYLNGAYQGVYQVAEHIRIAPDRVNIDAMKATDTSAAKITGGYLIEVDETRGEAFCPGGSHTVMVFCVKDPDTLLEPGWEKQQTYIVDYLRRTEDAIFGPKFADPDSGYAAYIDVPSAVDYYLLEEAVKNVDSNLRRGTYLYKPRGGKLHFGPVWDFDLAMGNVDYDGADQIEGWHTRQGAWYVRLFQDPAFVAKVKARWHELRTNGTISGIDNYARRRARLLDHVQQKNFQRWDILNVWVWPNRVVTGSYKGEVNAMLDWYSARVAWMDAQLAE